MQIVKKLFINAYLIKNKFQKDDRGSFIKFNQEIKIKNKKIKFDQFCYSVNKSRYTLRGIHYQRYPFQEEKLITCVEGKMLDVIVDLNKKSKTYLNYKFINLNQSNMYSLYIGKDYAHGFLTISKFSKFKFVSIFKSFNFKFLFKLKEKVFIDLKSIFSISIVFGKLPSIGFNLLISKFC